MRVLAILLSLIISLPSGALRVTLTPQGSDTLSQGALDGLYGLLLNTEAVLSAEGIDLLLEGKPLLWARPGAIGSGNTAAPMTAGTTTAFDARALGELLSPWETERTDSIDLQEAGASSRQLRYVLGEEGFSRVWPDIAERLGLPELGGASITGKATFRRYFDRQGQEIGAYFYAEKFLLAGVTREVRLEYARKPGGGFFLSYRALDKKGSGLRVSLHGKPAEDGWRLNGETRQIGGDAPWSCSLSGRTDGKLTLEWKASGAGTLLLERQGEDAADFTLTMDKKIALTGRVTWQEARLLSRGAAAEGKMEDVSAALARQLLAALRLYAPEDWQQLLHAFAYGVWIDAQKEEP